MPPSLHALQASLGSLSSAAQASMGAVTSALSQAGAQAEAALAAFEQQYCKPATFTPSEHGGGWVGRVESSGTRPGKPNAFHGVPAVCPSVPGHPSQHPPPSIAPPPPPQARRCLPPLWATPWL